MVLKLYGRGRIISFVGDALKREGISDRPMPIMVLVGPRGSGGTVLLGQLWKKCRDRTLAVSIDLATAQELSDVILATTQGLQRKVPFIRAIAFPRLNLAFKALSFDDDDGGRSSFDAYLRAGGAAARVNSVLPDWADQAGKLVQSVEARLLTAIMAQALRGLLSGIETHAGKEVLDWYRNNGISRGGGKYDPLWELYQWHHEHTDDASRNVDKTLCAALLADLRADFNESGFPHFQRAANPLLLLDNAGGAIGNKLLELLEECRRDSDRRDESSDPLLVVTVHRGRPRLPVGELIEATDENLTFAAFRAARWCPVRLTDLEPDDVLNMTRSRVLGSSRRDADFIHALTGGHPAATDRLVTWLDGFTGDVRQLMECKVSTDTDQSDGRETTVEDYLIGRVFADDLEDAPGDGPPPAVSMLDAAAVCAATPGLDVPACMAALGLLSWPINPAVVRDRLVAAMWLAEDDADGALSELHPLPLLLLRRRLARDAAPWRDANDVYVSYYARPLSRDDTRLNHHRLALVEPEKFEQLDTIIGYLDSELGERSTEDWLSTLNTVTEAPNRIGALGDRQVLVGEIAGIAAPGERRRVIGRLTVARWLYNDRQRDPKHRVAETVADEYANLAALSPPHAAAFHRQSRKYRKIQREWGD